MKRNRARRGRRFDLPEVSLTPLIDTALTLLVIFMIAIPAVHNTIRVDLPQGSSKEVVGKQEMVLTVRENGELLFNSFPVEKESLARVVKEALGNREDVPVSVNADKAVEYGKVVEVVDQLKQSGVKYVAMSLRPTRAVAGA
ncbi:biopolymer transporter ExbD [Candidatus Babeliales bacterium]|nr:biopolymer transporter ExbD [Candidatus Babeliales bacterium]